MFSSALKSISSTNINSHYTVAATPTCTAGPWKVYEAKKKSTGKACSVFVFDRKALDGHGGGLGRAGAAAFRRACDDVVARLKKEASSLARLRHPSVLELVEPVEETRGGGLQFATEAVTASLSSLLEEREGESRFVQDDCGESSPDGRGSSSTTTTSGAVGRGAAAASGAIGAIGTNAVGRGRQRRRREIEIDVLEIQKGLLQLGKALEFLHEKAGLVHGNLTPDAVLVNAKSDWKLSGLGFSGDAAAGASSSSSSSSTPVALRVRYELEGFDVHVLNPQFRLACPDVLLQRLIPTGPSGGGGANSSSTAQLQQKMASLLVQVTGHVVYGGSKDAARGPFTEVLVLAPNWDVLVAGARAPRGLRSYLILSQNFRAL